jgi:hypothetical protein
VSNNRWEEDDKVTMDRTKTLGTEALLGLLPLKRENVLYDLHTPNPSEQILDYRNQRHERKVYGSMRQEFRQTCTTTFNHVPGRLFHKPEVVERRKRRNPQVHAKKDTTYACDNI